MKTTDNTGDKAGQLDPNFGVGGIVELRPLDEDRGFEIIDSAGLQDGGSVHVIQTHEKKENYLASFNQDGKRTHLEHVILPDENQQNTNYFFRLKYNQLDRIACYVPDIRWPSEEHDPIVHTSAVGCFETNLKPQEGFGENGITTIKPADLAKNSPDRRAPRKSEAPAAGHTETPEKHVYDVNSGEAQLINGALWSVSSSYHEYEDPPFKSWISKFAQDTGKLLSVLPLQPLEGKPWEPVDVHFFEGGGFIMLAYREQQAYLTKFTDSGMLDKTFNDSGYVEMPGLAYKNSCMHVHQERILIASMDPLTHTKKNDHQSEPLLKLDAYLLSGERDSTFTSRNDAVKNAVYISSPHIAVDAKNRILVGLTGDMQLGTSPDPLVAMIYRFSWAGNADLTFNGDGRFVLSGVVAFKHMFLNGNEIRGVGNVFSSQEPIMFKVLD
ncbi:hypothetical protein [uncultured Pseudomonas sp.]|uniref:hypothetical protein n=1 Tax=uncultured Pseudomonas sp. TaxID=114707 RepID=UPI00258D2ACB|nr:hypothetical protein [uncultured Pseudomonas sp.]